MCNPEAEIYPYLDLIPTAFKIVVFFRILTGVSSLQKLAYYNRPTFAIIILLDSGCTIGLFFCTSVPHREVDYVWPPLFNVGIRNHRIVVAYC